MLMLQEMDSFPARTLTRHKSEATFQRHTKRAKQLAAEGAFYAAIGEECPESRHQREGSVNTRLHGWYSVREDLYRKTLYNR
jgi:hypothetical protein